MPEMEDLIVATDKGLRDALNLLCEEARNRLPDEYDLNLFVNRQEADLELVDPEGEVIQFDAEGDAWGSAIEAAIDHEREAKQQDKT